MNRLLSFFLFCFSIVSAKSLTARAKAGDRCLIDASNCGKGMVCIKPRMLPGNEGTCQVWKIVGEGESCGSDATTCAKGLKCVVTDDRIADYPPRECMKDDSIGRC